MSGLKSELDGAEGGLVLHAVHHAQHVKFGKSKALKLLPRDLEAQVNSKVSQKQKRLEIAASSIKSARSKSEKRTSSGRTQKSTKGGLSSSRDNGIEAEVNDGGEEDKDEDEDDSDEDFRSTKQAIFEAVRKDLNELWYHTSGSNRPLGDVLTALQKRLSMTITGLKEREEEAIRAKEGVSALIEERNEEIKQRMVD